MSAPSPRRRAFADAVQQPDAEIDLAQAALLIAQEEYPTLEVAPYLARLDTLAAGVQARLGQAVLPAGGVPPAPAAARHGIIAALNQVLFEDEGFHGNTADYYDPRNSFLNDVLDRRTGIPITISLVYMEVAARVGLPLLGVGAPGHFIVQYPGPGYDPARPARRPHPGELFIDPYHGGVLHTRADCAAWFQQRYGPDFIFTEEYLTPLTRRQILARMLNNLKGIYLRRHDFARSLSVVDRLLLVEPDAIWELKDRGLLHYRLGAFDAARTDLLDYLERDPDTEDAARLQYYVRLCDNLLQMSN